MLDGHDGRLAEKAAKAGGVDAASPLGIDSKVAHVVEAIEQRDHIGGRR
jgi:hypothetical protein